MPQKITYTVAKAFFEDLEDNESSMGEGAALALTLEQFGYRRSDLWVLGDMAAVYAGGKVSKMATKRAVKRAMRKGAK